MLLNGINFINQRKLISIERLNMDSKQRKTFKQPTCENTKINTNTENENNDKISEILHALVDINNMNKIDFFKSVFEGVFKLIKEA